jgi:hypothetical protein
MLRILAFALGLVCGTTAIASAQSCFAARTYHGAGGIRCVRYALNGVCLVAQRVQPETTPYCYAANAVLWAGTQPYRNFQVGPPRPFYGPRRGSRFSYPSPVRPYFPTGTGYNPNARPPR